MTSPFLGSQVTRPTIIYGMEYILHRIAFIAIPWNIFSAANAGGCWR